MERYRYANGLGELIPKMFDLDRYREASKLDSLGWYANLFRRRLTSASLHALSEEGDSRSRCVEGLLSVLGRPSLFDESFFGLLEEGERDRMIALGMGWSAQTIERAAHSLEFRGVRSMSLGDIMEIRSDLRERPALDELIARHQSIWDIAKYEIGSKERNLLTQMYETPFDNFRGTCTKKKVVRAYASIDLSMPDKLLLESFRLWLKSARIMFDFGEKSIKPFSEAQHFRNWASQQILPYLDLDLWHRFNGKKTTKRQMQDILFPGQPKSERAFYKGTIETIKWLFEEGGLDVLRMQADAEHSLEVQEILRRKWGGVPAERT
jgi:hypothetical protein